SAGNRPEKRAIRGMLAVPRVRCPDRQAFLPMQVLACRDTPGKREFGRDPFPRTGGRRRPRGAPSCRAADLLEWTPPFLRGALGDRVSVGDWPLKRKTGERVMKVMTIGLDLAKNVFQVHGVNERGVAVLRKQLKRDQLVPFFARLEPCLIGIEACGGAHFWAAKLAALGHQVKMMAAQFVKPYVKTNKNDSLDAEAICEAVTRPNMRFVPIKSAEQPSVLSLHTAREAFVHARTAQANQIRGLLLEFGLVVPIGIRHVFERVPSLIEDGEIELPGLFRQLIDRLLLHLKELDRQVQELEHEIEQWHRSSEPSKRLESIPGIGPITASALV